MKPIVMFELSFCPHCRNARRWIAEEAEAHPEYRDLSIEYVDEIRERERASRHDYYLVPSFYVDGVKVHEGVASRDIVARILSDAYTG